MPFYKLGAGVRREITGDEAKQIEKKLQEQVAETKDFVSAINRPDSTFSSEIEGEREFYFDKVLEKFGPTSENFELVGDTLGYNYHSELAVKYYNLAKTSRLTDLFLDEKIHFHSMYFHAMEELSSSALDYHDFNPEAINLYENAKTRLQYIEENIAPAKLPDLYFFIGFTFVRNAKHQEAILWFKKALSKQSGHLLAKRHLDNATSIVEMYRTHLGLNKAKKFYSGRAEQANTSSNGVPGILVSHSPVSFSGIHPSSMPSSSSSSSSKGTHPSSMTFSSVPSLPWSCSSSISSSSTYSFPTEPLGLFFPSSVSWQSSPSLTISPSASSFPIGNLAATTTASVSLPLAASSVSLSIPDADPISPVRTNVTQVRTPAKQIVKPPVPLFSVAPSPPPYYAPNNTTFATPTISLLEMDPHSPLRSGPLPTSFPSFWSSSVSSIPNPFPVSSLTPGTSQPSPSSSSQLASSRPYPY